MLTASAKIYLKWIFVFFSVLAGGGYFFSLSSFELSWILITYLLVLLLVAVPFFITKNFLDPICIYSALLILQLTDFALQDALGAGLRYFPDLAGDKVLELKLLGLLIIALWAVSLNAGYFLPFLGRKFIKYDMNNESQRTAQGITWRNKKVINIFSGICFIFSVAGFLGGLNVAGSVAGMVEGMSSRSETYMGYGYLRIMAQFGVLGAIGFLLNKKIKLSLFALLFAFMATAMFGGRAAAFLGVILPYVFVYNWTHKKFSGAKVLFFGLIGVFFVFLMEIFKFTGRGLALDLTKIISSVSRGMSDILPSMIHAIHIGLLDLQYGKTFLNFFYGLVPRAFWPNKPEGVGEDALLGRALIGEEYWGLPPGPFGVAYLNFSYVGVIVFGVMVGVLSRYLFIKYAKSLRNSRTPWLALLYPFIFIKVFNFFSVYSMIQSFVALVFVCVFFYAISIMLRLRLR